MEVFLMSTINDIYLLLKKMDEKIDNITKEVHYIKIYATDLKRTSIILVMITQDNPSIDYALCIRLSLIRNFYGRPFSIDSSYQMLSK